MVESSLLVRWVIKANLLAELIENPTASIEREKEMNESCPECGGKVSGCKWDKSNGIDLQTKTNHLDNYLDKNKSWNEFIDYANSQLADHLGRSHPDMYYESKEFNKIGLLIEYLKSVGLRHEKEIVLSDLEVEKLESKVKSLKPKEDDEVEELANELYLSGGGSGKLTTPGGIEYWETIARKAIEIIKGKA